MADIIGPYEEVRPGDKFVVTGVDRNGKRFRLVYDSWLMASSVNVWRGNVWLLRNGKRRLLQSTFN